MTTQSRAKRGGEVALNGEFYEGGKFLPNTERSKGKAAKRGPRKEQFEPFGWAVPEAGRRAIFGAVVGSVAQYVDRYDPAAGIKPFEPGMAHYGTTALGFDVAELCEMYNRGVRWI